MCGKREEEKDAEFLNVFSAYQQHGEPQNFEHLGAVQGGFLVPEISPPHAPAPSPVLLNPVRYIPSHTGGPDLQPIIGRSFYQGQTSDHLRIISEALRPMMQIGSTTGQFGRSPELGGLTAQEMMDAKALAASKSHSEAERRRRERINNHLANLRTLLPSTTKTDKASLLAEVIHRLKELKRQTSVIAEAAPLPTEMDEVTIEPAEDVGRLVIKASICCDDRNDLLPDLIRTLKSLGLRTLDAEITTIGERVKTAFFVTAEDEESTRSTEQQRMQFVASIRDALRAVVDKTNGEECAPGASKRQRTVVN